jgi:hypothetical protein
MVCLSVSFCVTTVPTGLSACLPASIHVTAVPAGLPVCLSVCQYLCDRFTRWLVSQSVFISV